MIGMLLLERKCYILLPCLFEYSTDSSGTNVCSIFYYGKTDPGTPCLREIQCQRDDFLQLVLLEMLINSEFFLWARTLVIRSLKHFYKISKCFIIFGILEKISNENKSCFLFFFLRKYTLKPIHFVQRRIQRKFGLSKSS